MFFIRCLLQEFFHRCDNQGQWRTQFMTHISEKFKLEHIQFVYSPGFPFLLGYAKPVIPVFQKGGKIVI